MARSALTVPRIRQQANNHSGGHNASAAMPAAKPIGLTHRPGINPMAQAPSGVILVTGR
jgi:hypothetical protein